MGNKEIGQEKDKSTVVPCIWTLWGLKPVLRITAKST